MPEPSTDRAAKVDTGDLYERTRVNFVKTVVALRDESLDARVPSTPAWSVRDVLAHVVGLAADLNGQRFPSPEDGAGSEWTDRQVARGRGRPVADIVAEWDREAPIFEEGLRAFGYETGSHFVADLHAHYQDVRGALGETPETDELTVRVALDHYTGFMDQMLSEAQWGTLEIDASGELIRLGGAGDHRAKLCAPPFEVLRALSGRRSARQIRALDWEGDVDALLAWLQSVISGGYAIPAADLTE